MLFHVRTDAYTEINVGMSIGILILEAMISKSTIEMLASVDEQHILTVRDLVEETFEYPFQFQIPLSSLPMGKFTVDALRQLINSLGAKAGVKKCHPHRFRHTFAITYLRSDGDIFILKSLLEHGSLEIELVGIRDF